MLLRRYDWNLEVRGVEEQAESLPMKSLRLLLDSVTVYHHREHALRVLVGELDDPDCPVDSTILSRSQRFRFRETPYILEVTLLHVWVGLETTSEPRSICSISMYDTNWDKEKIEHWGAHSSGNGGGMLETLFPGTETSLEARFDNFVKGVWETQEALEAALPWKAL